MRAKVTINYEFKIKIGFFLVALPAVRCNLFATASCLAMGAKRIFAAIRARALTIDATFS